MRGICSRWLAVALLIPALLSACSRSPAPQATPITLQLSWTHEAVFAGFYAAAQAGFYADEGLEVAFREGGPKVEPQEAVLNGTALFGVDAADMLILARAAGKPVKAIATIFRRSPAVFIAKASSGIKRPQDFVGKVVRTTVSLGPTLHAMMTQVGIGPGEYREQILPTDAALFASGEAPIWGAYLNSFVVTLELAGHALNIIYPDDYGVHFSASTVITTDAVIASQPELVRRFLRASLKGWTYAIDNPDGAARHVLKYAPGADAAVEAAKLRASVPLVETGKDYLGWIEPEKWAGMERILRVERLSQTPREVLGCDIVARIEAWNRQSLIRQSTESSPLTKRVSSARSIQRASASSDTRQPRLWGKM